MAGKRHVSRAQIQALERGELVTLNDSQLEELRRFAPGWVRITAVRDSSIPGSFGTFHTVAIDDTRSGTLTGLITRGRDAAARDEEHF